MSSATPAIGRTIDHLVPRRPDVLRALAWRFGRHGTLSIYAPVLIFCGMPTLVYGMLRISSPELLSSGWEDPSSLRRLYFIFAAMTLPTLVLIEMIAQLRSLYVLPIPTRRIVNTQFALGTLTIIGVHLLTALYYRLLFGAPIPVFGPLLILIPMMFVCAGGVALWIEAVWWRMLLSIGLLAGFGWWWQQQLSDDSLRSDLHWMTPMPGELLLLLAMGTAGYVVTYRTVARDRRGDTGSWENLEVYLHRLVLWIGRLIPWERSGESAAGGGTRAAMDRPHRHALAASASYEWQTRGLVLPIVALGLGAISLINAWFDPANWLQSYVWSLPSLLVLGLGINGYFVGMMDGPTWTGEMDRYRATRPLSDRQLANVLLRNGLKSGATALLVTAVLAVIVYLWGRLVLVPHERLWPGFTNAPRASFSGVGGYLLALVGFVLAGWAGMGFNLSCAATGRHWIIPSVWFAAIAAVLGTVLLGSHLEEVRMAEIWQSLLLVLSVLAAVMTVLCYHQAITRRLVTRRHWLIMAGLWILGAALLNAALRHREMTAATVLTLIGAGSLVAPTDGIGPAGGVVEPAPLRLLVAGPSISDAQRRVQLPLPCTRPPDFQTHCRGGRGSG